MIFGRRSQWFALGGVAALLYGSPTHPDRRLNAALDGPDASAYALAGSEVSVADRDQKPPVSNADTKAVSTDLDTAIVPVAVDPNAVPADLDRFPATADVDATAAPADGAVRLAAVEPGARVTSVEPGARVNSVRSSDECILTQTCIDEYLWSVYARTPKFDTVKIEERISATVKKKGKRQSSTKTVAKLVSEDFTWKDS